MTIYRNFQNIYGQIIKIYGLNMAEISLNIK